MDKGFAEAIAEVVVSAFRERHDRIEQQLEELKQQGRNIMTGQQHLQASIDTLATTSVAELGAIKTDIDALKAKQQAGTLTDTDFDGMATRIDTVTAAIDTLKTAADAASADSAPANPAA